jgi:predicted 2-oxoglutarate/Fe(II)-dependent dioxygenase YbiX/peroxiredoxin
MTMTNSPLNVGEPAPWFAAATDSNHSGGVMFDELAGRYIVLFFFGSAARPDAAEVLAAFERRNDLFDDGRALFVGISNDAEDFNQGRVRQHHAAQLFLLDSNGVATRQYLSQPAAVGRALAPIRPTAFVLSPALQIIEIVALAEPATFVGRIASLLNELPARSAGLQNTPVLVVPQIFDRAFCGHLIDLYESAGGREIGSIENDGKVVESFDQKFRKRLDWHISDEPALQRARELLERRLLPMIYRAFQFRTTRIERYLVGCYDAETGGYFRPHRDNTAPPVAHRRFAVTINLNEDYDGGYLRFPEFGDRTYRTPPGDAIVFSCSLLHEVTPITRDRRYAFLSFFYDEPSQLIRDEFRKKWIESRQPVDA